MFYEKNYLLLLLLIPLLAALLSFFYKKRQKDLGLLISRANFAVLSNVNLKAYKIKNFLLIAGFVFLILALARPQYGKKDIEAERKSSEIVIALDISRSMLAEDVKPSRMERAKMLVSRIIQDCEGDKIGIMVFSAMAMWQCPMTYDGEALKMFLQGVNTGSLPYGGTEFSSPINLAVKALGDKSSDSRAMVMITDGEDHDTKTKEAINAAKKAGLKIISVGIGTAQGSPIPERDYSGSVSGYVEDSKGKTVVSRLDSGLLRQIASETDGKYFEISGRGDVSADVISRLNDLDKDLQGKEKESGKRDGFQIFLLLAFASFVAGIFYPETVKKQK